MASPEEMLEHPANDLVRNFLGKHTPGVLRSFQGGALYAHQRSHRQAGPGRSGCAERMARGSVDTLLVTTMRRAGMWAPSPSATSATGAEGDQHRTAGAADRPDRRVGDEAKESFDYLLDSGANYGGGPQ